MEANTRKLAVLAAASAILSAAASLAVFYLYATAKPTEQPQQLPTVTVTGQAIGCATLEHLQAMGVIANKGSAETFSQAVDYAQASGKCQALPPGTRISIVQADPVYTDLVTQDGRRLLAYTDTLGEAE